MALSFSQLRSAVSSQIADLAGFHLIKMPPAYFGRTQQTISHLGFTVGISSTQQTDERQRRNNGYYINSVVLVVFMYRLRPADLYPTDYDLCLDKEQLVINKVLSSYSSIQSEVQIRYNSTERQISDSMEYMIASITFNTLHTIN